MFKNLSIKHKLTAGFGAIMAIVLVLLAVINHSFDRLSEARRWDRHTLEVMREAADIGTYILQVQSSLRGHALSGDETVLASIHIELEALQQHMKLLLELTSDNASQQNRLRKLDGLLTTWRIRAAATDAGARGGAAAGTAPARAPRAGDRVLADTAAVAAMRKLLDEFSAEEARLLQARQAEAESLREWLALLVSAGAVTCLVACVVLGTLLVRAMSRQLSSLLDTARRLAGGEKGARAAVLSNDELGRAALELNRMAQGIEDALDRERAAGDDLRTKVDALLETVSRAAHGDLTGTITVRGDDTVGRLGEGIALMLDNLRSLIDNVQRAGILVTTSATQIAAFARQQEATGMEQAQTSVEVLSTTREISANTAQLLRTVEEATEVAEYTTAATTEAEGNLRHMDRSMQQMVAATDTISAKLATLSEKASNINSVLATIVKVADQTNILSLNAAIEAEKAGEAGRGFGVVAIEIRRLADQTAVSTWDIEQMLKDMQSAVAASVMGMDKFTDDIRRSVDEMRSIAAQLSGMTEQVRKLPPRFDMVLQGMQSQALGATQIADTMNGLSEASQQTVDSLKATSEAVYQLKHAADNLQQSVATFAINS